MRRLVRFLLATLLLVESLSCQTLIVTGKEDRLSPPSLCTTYCQRISQYLPPVVLKAVGHWHLFEDPHGVSDATCEFL